MLFLIGNTKPEITPKETNMEKQNSVTILIRNFFLSTKYSIILNDSPSKNPIPNDPSVSPYNLPEIPRAENDAAIKLDLTDERRVQPVEIIRI